MKVLAIEIARVKQDQLKSIIEYVNEKLNSILPDVFVLPEKWLDKELKMSEALDIASQLELDKIMISIPGSFSIYDDSNLYNRSLVFKSGKYAGYQDKLIPYGSEKIRYSPGKAINIFKLRDFTFNVAVCYDIDFPFFARISAINGSDIIINPSLIRSYFSYEWHLYIMARSLENRIPIISVNSSSPYFEGKSIMVHPYAFKKGAKLKIIHSNEGVLSGSLSPEDFRELRDQRIIEDPGKYSSDVINVKLVNL